MDNLETALNATGISFAHYGWSHSPSGDYGVYAEENANDFGADSEHAERVLTGTVDLYTHDDTRTQMALVEGALKASCIAWYLNSIQFEEDTKYIHFEWVFSVEV